MKGHVRPALPSGLTGVASRRRALLGILAATAFAWGAGEARADEAASLEHARQETPPSWAGPTTPAKAPAGIKVGIISCGAQFRGCQAPADAAFEAAKKIGWTPTMYDGAGTQEKQNASILDAISAGANVILTVSIDPRFIQLALQTAKKAGVPMISGSAGIDTPNPVIKPEGDNLTHVLDVGTDYPGVGRHVAEWIIADSGGKANVLVYTDEEFYSVTATVDGLLEGLKKCAGCVVSPLQKFTASQVATNVGQMVVGYLQSHPEVTYVYAPYDPSAVFMVNAIVQAGLADKVKVASIVGAAQNLDFIRQGRVQVLDGAFDNAYMGYAMVDQAIRVLNKQPLFEPHDEGTPYQILDKTNLPPEGQDWATKSDYKERFLKLWQ